MAYPELIDELVDEIGHNYPRGRIIVAVDGAPGTPVRETAHDLSLVFDERGRPARFLVTEPTSAADFDVDVFRHDIIEGFKAEAEADEVLLVGGHVLLDPAIKGLWHFSVYLDDAAVPADQEYLGSATPFFSASAVVDTGSGRRIFSDSC